DHGGLAGGEGDPVGGHAVGAVDGDLEVGGVGDDLRDGLRRAGGAFVAGPVDAVHGGGDAVAPQLGVEPGGGDGEVLDGAADEDLRGAPLGVEAREPLQCVH
ncbi:hypothetical protein ADL26_20890, partial [Thermoactinomyces vulgaris]